MRKRNVLIVVVALVIIVGVALVIAFWVPPTPTSLTVVRIATAGEPVTLDPHNEISTIDMLLSDQVHEPLINASWEGGFKLLPNLATSWELVNDTTWRFTLREGVKYHDGTPFNASAVKYTIDRLLDENRKTSSVYAIEGLLKSAEVEDEYTILFYTEDTWPGLPFTFAHPRLGIIGPTACEKYGDLDYGRHIVGTGPFKFAEWVEGSYIKFVKNEDYWGEVPKLDEVIVKIIPEEDTRYLAFLAGELDIISNVPPHRAPEIEASMHYKLIRSPALRTIYFGLNTLRYPLEDIRLRRAIAHAFDRDNVIVNILEDLGLPATVPVPPGGQDRLLEEEYGPGGKYPYDPEKAKELIAEAGWVDTDGDGIVEKDGKSLRINLVSPDGRYLKDSDICVVMAEYLRGVGIDVEVQILDWAGFAKRITSADFDMHLLGWGVPGMLEKYIKRIWGTVDPELGRGAWSAYSDPELDELWRIAEVEMDPEKRTEFWQDAQRIIMEDVPMIPIYFTINIYATTNDVQNFFAKSNEMLILNNLTVDG